MDDLKILVTGDYWHEDFQACLSKIQFPLTMVQPTKASAVADSDFGLIVVTQSRRDQVLQPVVDELQQQHTGTPIVLLLGSWCEGELRSGTPIKGAHRVYWHQWQNQFESFASNLKGSGISNWHQPPTTTKGDYARDGQDCLAKLDMNVGVSATSRVAYETLQDAIESVGGSTYWVEQNERKVSPGTVICIDANSVTEILLARIEEFRTRFENPAFVVILNFPRKQEIDELAKWNVSEVLSKPFAVDDLLASLIRASAGVTPGEPQPKLNDGKTVSKPT